MYKRDESIASLVRSACVLFVFIETQIKFTLCRPDNLHIILQSILSMKVPEKLEPILKEAVQLSFRQLDKLSPAHLSLLISKAGNLAFTIPYKKLQVRLLEDRLCLSCSPLSCCCNKRLPSLRSIQPRSFEIKLRRQMSLV